jgi:tartrate dehydratase beta subunit/fumarate hydratase class I family protein
VVPLDQQLLGRMDSYVGQFQAAGGSMIMLAKGNRSKQVGRQTTLYLALVQVRSYYLNVLKFHL